MKKIILLALLAILSQKMSAIEIENILISSVSNQTINVRLNTIHSYTYSYESYQYNITNHTITLDVCYIPGDGAAISYLENDFQIPVNNTIINNYTLIVNVYYINLINFNCDYQTIKDTKSLSFSTPLSGNVSLGTNNIVVSSNVSILYPNPTNGILFFSEEKRIENIEIYNSQGISTTKINKLENKLDLNNFENGIYFVKIKTENEILIEKIILRK